MKYLESPIFYMGNKYKLLKQLIPLFPKQCDTFLDLFGGSGVVSMNYQGTRKTIYNEFNGNIVNLVKTMVENKPQELDLYFKDKIKQYDLETCDIKTVDKISKAGYERRKDNYNKLRYDYNNSINKDSQFNASSGKGTYNEKRYKKICDMNEQFKNIEIFNKNCFDIDFSLLEKGDFVYCDPPYLNTEAVYNEKRAFGGWNIDDDYKLFDILEKLNDKGVKWGLSNVFVNRGKENTHLIEWCNKNNWNVYHLNRNYNPFSRGNSNNDEVYICNYEIDVEG